ncbi:ATP-binding protein [Streptomyces sp. NPDC002018]|uniref:ATP-binding protein n=1 Tax=Streptomyces sp. NPDC002018 TaxID=3364629 RepID=UPI00367D1CD0
MTVTAIPHPTGHPGYSEILPCEPRSAAVARRLVRTALRAWGQEGLIDDGALIVTELVANAARHSGSRLIRVVISPSPGGFVRLGVVDRSRTLPMMRADSDAGNTRGRGLLLVDALTDRWGTDLYRWGKQVWGELRCEVRP